jgi:hypothetical protein
VQQCTIITTLTTAATVVRGFFRTTITTITRKAGRATSSDSRA